MKRLTVFLLSLLVACTTGLVACGDDDPTTTPEPTPTPTPTPTPEPEPDPTPVVQVAVGWPEAYDGVMLQGFYWDSYSDTKWTQLTAQADELAQNFQLIWVPNSGYCGTMSGNMGYHPMYWFMHKGPFGTEDELRTMISTFKQKGTGIIEDVVINHRVGVTDWCDFPAETYKGVTYQLGMADICKNDECKNNGFNPTGAYDTGDAWDYARDLDHSGENVQKNVKAYLDFLLNDLGYVGFRYDLVKGYAPKYTGLYNATALPKFSVGEYWDGNKAAVVNWLNGTKQEGQIQSAAFDFPLKYKLNDAFGSGTWNQLAQSVLANDKAYQRYAVTFVDNHDTYREDARLKRNVCAANAYILTMPGTPCLFFKHWQMYKGTLKRLIALRKAAGITNQSDVVTATVTSYGYMLVVQGTKGKVALQLGNKSDFDDFNNAVDQYSQVLSGKNFAIFASKGVDLTAVKAITDVDADLEDDGPVAIPDFCTVTASETCAFFEAPSSWGDIMCWAWDNSNNYTGGSWPGTSCTLVGTTTKGKKVWKWSYNGTLTTKPAFIIFNEGQDKSQTADMNFTNGGYYTEDGLQGVVKAGQ